MPSFNSFFSLALKHCTPLMLGGGLLIVMSWPVRSQTLDDKLFVEAMHYVEKRQWQKAEAILEFQLKQNPGWHRARIELAQVYRQQSKWQQAIEQLDSVLNIANLPPPVRANLQQLKSDILTSIKTANAPGKAPETTQPNGELNASPSSNTPIQPKRHTLSSYVELSYGYDDNVRFSSGDYFLNDDPLMDGFFFFDGDGNLLFLSPDGFVFDAAGNLLFENDGFFDLGNPDTGNTFVETHLAVNHQFQVPTLRRGDDSTLFTWQNQLLLQSTENTEFSEFNKLQFKFSTDMSWQLNDTHVFSLSGHSRLLKRDNQVQVRSNGLSPSFTFYTEWGAWEVGYEWLRREYEEAQFIQGDFISIFAAFNSTTDILSLKWSKLFLNNQLLLLTKAETMDSDTSDNFDFTGLRGTLAAVYRFNDQLTWSFSVVDLSLDYNTPFDTDTGLKDDSTTYKTRLSYDIDQSWSVFFSAERGRRDSDIYGGISSDKQLSKIGIKFTY